ncbi:MAG: hypothetical protein HY303_20695 [Candidatus Wallbacteria bacterium]|nr:hypothetical protein [Candidatus Wallbacteria bacterium]
MPSTDPRQALRDFLERFCSTHGTELVSITDDILGFTVPPSVQDLLPSRKQVEFPLILSQAVDPAAEESSCRDLSKLVEHSLADGHFCHVTCEPRIGLEAAALAASRAKPNGSGEEPRVVYRSLALINFRMVYRHLQDEVSHPAFVFELAGGIPAQEAASLLTYSQPWEAMPLAPEPTERLKLVEMHDRAVRELESHANRRLEEIRQWLDQQDRARREVMESYFDELAKELEEERRSVYYHLYFFEKEQEIEEKIKRIQDERSHRKGPPSPPVRPSCSVELVNIGLFRVPFAAVGTGSRAVEIDLLEGKVSRVGDRYQALV